MEEKELLDRLIVRASDQILIETYPTINNDMSLIHNVIERKFGPIMSVWRQGTFLLYIIDRNQFRRLNAVINY